MSVNPYHIVAWSCELMDAFKSN